jgi:succinate dehydrogenase / fumarate reductase, flavoprotein subunit
VTTDHDAFKSATAETKGRIDKMLATKGTKTVDELHRKLGKVMWDNCGMSRSQETLQYALAEIPKIRDEFNNDVRVTGTANELNGELEKAGRVADFIDLGELMCRDALEREESCGGHFRTEHQTEDNEALRNDEKFCHAAVWEFNADGNHKRHQEQLVFENVKLATRSYK